MSSGLGGIKERLSRRKSLRKMSRSRRNSYSKMPVSLRGRNMDLSRRKSYSKMPLSLRRRKMSRSKRKTYKMF